MQSGPRPATTSLPQRSGSAPLGPRTSRSAPARHQDADAFSRPVTKFPDADLRAARRTQLYPKCPDPRIRTYLNRIAGEEHYVSNKKKRGCGSERQCECLAPHLFLRETEAKRRGRCISARRHCEMHRRARTPNVGFYCRVFLATRHLLRQNRLCIRRIQFRLPCAALLL